MPVRTEAASQSAPRPRAMTGGRFALVLWLVLAAAAATAQLEGGPAPTTTAMETSAAASRPPLGVPAPPPPTTKPSTSKRALDPKKRPNDVYAPVNGSFDYYKLQVYWPSSIFKPQQ